MAIVLIIACIMGLNKATIIGFPVLVIVAVMLHNGFGLFLGYMGGKLFRMDEADCRTVGIEVGMQNSGSRRGPCCKVLYSRCGASLGNLQIVA